MTRRPADVHTVADQRDVLAEVRAERARQDAKWGANRPLALTPWLGILVEEVGESATASFAGTLADLREELVQVAAVAVAWIESIDAHIDGSGDSDE